MTQDPQLIATPQSLPKGGGAIQSLGADIGTVGSSGAATCEIALPISAGRGYAPALSLRYSSSHGNGVFGLGWYLPVPTISRRTSLGVPAYNDEDLFVGPEGTVWMPDRNKDSGAIESTRKHYADDTTNPVHTVVRYRPRVERCFDRIEHWSSADNPVGFWLVGSADGHQHVYGKTPSARRADPAHPDHVAEWLLEESMNAHGEHILYEYSTEPLATGIQCYLTRVRYGNVTGAPQLYAFTHPSATDRRCHFELCFDFGERATTLEDKPDVAGRAIVEERPDPFSDFRYGFELRTTRLCRQVLMFHHFPDEEKMTSGPILVRRALFEYQTSPLSCRLLTAVFNQAYGSDGNTDYLPPLEFSYTPFDWQPEITRFQPFEVLNTLQHPPLFQFVDLYGEGLPGILQQTEKAWRYCAPKRHEDGGDRVDYLPAQLLPHIPVADTGKSVRQILGHFTGNDRPDWLMLQPGISGFFTLDALGKWSGFTPFEAFPTEFFQANGQLVDLMGTGLGDLAIIGPRSVRLNASLGKAGFKAATDILRMPDDDDLPSDNHSPSELVAFSDVLGSGQQHLVRIRHNEMKCWPNLGRGRFGTGRVIAPLDFAYESFDASRILLADLDGSGATDLIYLQADGARIFMNCFGNGLAAPIKLPWPNGLHLDRFCRVRAADLQGTGCSSLVIEIPGSATRYWRYDFVNGKPYLLGTTDNNMGAIHSIRYRSSAQEWLDEKKQLLAKNKKTLCRLPFPLPVVKEQTVHDEITDNRLTRHFTYRRAAYDSKEREFRGFGLLEQTDSLESGSSPYSAHSPPMLSKTWFHSGDTIDPLLPVSDWRDKDAVALKPAIQNTGESWSPDTHKRKAATAHWKSRQREMAIALAGSVLREETYARDADARSVVPYSVQTYRYQLNELRGRGKHSPCSIVHPVLAETVRLEYERIADDPQCRHTLNLQWDQYGFTTHSMEIRYARRKQATDASPFTDEWQQQWWRDAHDDQQQFYYVQENRERYIHLDAGQNHRLGLPYLQCAHVLRLPKSPLPDGLDPAGINHESMLKLSATARWKTLRVLTALSVLRYRDSKTDETLADGQASIEALVDHRETAEINDLALKAFATLQTAPRAVDIREKLQASGYRNMTIAPPLQDTWAIAADLWSVRRDYTTYQGADGFFRPKTFSASRQQGPTTIGYDRYHFLITSITLPDQCTTRTRGIDYRTLSATQLIDPNGIIREARYDGFGNVRVLSQYKNTVDKQQGFKPLDAHPLSTSTDAAIESPQQSLQQAASAFFYAPLSWMGMVAPVDTEQESQWRNQAIASGELLPGGFIRASTRKRLQQLATLTPAQRYLRRETSNAVREPVHSVALQADRYPDAAGQQIGIMIASQDGFGRSLQNKQKVDARWRVSAPVEYDNKGRVIRLYRPWFSDDYRYSHDAIKRTSGFCDQQFYDPAGRLIRVINASGDERRYAYHPWYTLSEDENDTHADKPFENTLSLEPGDAS